MGSLSNRPKVPKADYPPMDGDTVKMINKGHHNLIECHEALEYLSKKGRLVLDRTPKTYIIKLWVNGDERFSFRGKSLCHALKGLLEKYKNANIN